MQSMGLLLKWEQEWSPVITDCNQLQTSAIELKSLFTVFLMLGVGAGLSVVVLSMEICYKRRTAVKVSRFKRRTMHLSS